MENHSIEVITSTKNQRIQQIRELLSKKSARDEVALFVTEGIRLCEEAIASSTLPEIVVFCEPLPERGIKLVEKAGELGCKLIKITPNVLETLSDTTTSQGIMMVMPIVTAELPKKADLIVILDQLRDPGNMGTILRTADAAGVQAVICTPGSVDPFSSKVVRSAMGAHFHLPIVRLGWPQILEYREHQKNKFKLLLTDSEKGTTLWEKDLTSPIAFIIGGEADGASEEARNAADEFIRIPMPGKTESLNAAVAAGAVLYEIIRQRSR